MTLKGYGTRILLSCLAGLAVACDSATGPGSERFELAFARSDRGSFTSDVYVSRADGSHATRLTTDGNAGRPRWSPDGSKIVFGTSTTYSATQVSTLIELMNADGTDRHVLASGTNPVWSPDGAQIGFTAYGGLIYNCCAAPTKIDQIYTMKADGTNQTRIAPDTVFNYMGSWSPDGSRIVFARFTVAIGNAEIFVMAADGTSQVRLTYNGPRTSNPVWSPTGEKIAFVGWQDPHHAIYTMNADGSSQTRLTSATAEDMCPAWSPDGSRIAFTSNRDGFSQIYLMNADGSGQIRITSDFSDSCPSWKSP